MLEYNFHVINNSDDYDIALRYADTEKNIDFTITADAKQDNLENVLLDVINALSEELVAQEEHSELDLLLEGDEDELMEHIVDLYEKNIALEAELENLKTQKNCACHTDNQEIISKEETEEVEDNPTEDDSNIYDTLKSMMDLTKNYYHDCCADGYTDYLTKFINKALQ